MQSFMLWARHCRQVSYPVYEFFQVIFLICTVLWESGTFLAFLGRGPRAVWFGTLSVLATYWENSQMKLFSIFCKGF